MPIPEHFRLELSPLADPAAIVEAGNARFSLLTDRLIRMEYSPSRQFEDHASQAFWYRRQTVPPFQTRWIGERLEIETDHLILAYQPRKLGFTRQSLSVQVKSTGAVWHYKDKWGPSRQLFGTARTLDEASGRTELEPGPMSRLGWAVINDSKSVVFNEEGWAQPRLHPDNLDLYFFGYGHDYPGCLRDLCKVAGEMPLIPRYILGNWWSRYWAYTQSELGALMDDFASQQVPLSVCIIDMDWHLDGWTGYTWNRQRWPDPGAFIAWLHAKGLHTALNLHPSDGVGPHEAQYPAMAAALGQDPAEGDEVAFDIANPVFVQAYFELLHHPYEAMGVDFWWMDWQQERITSMPGLDPLWWLNHLHYLDLGRDGKKRPFIFSRWGGLGNHRYPIGFSGDTEITWDSLAFQPYFTATAANVGYGWWSHDIGGHMGGIEDDELYARWVQFGVFSPILRLHSTKNAYHDRRPWGRGRAAAHASAEALRLRHRLVPYIYSMAWRCYRESIPLITPMYYWNPEEEAAYEARDQYWFGSQLVVAPFTAPADPQIGLSRGRVWLPEGEWYHFFTGESISGGGWSVRYGGLEDMSVFARAGAIVPLAAEEAIFGVENPDALSLHVFPGAEGSFDLYEDDGETTAYRISGYAVTRFTLGGEAEGLRFSIEPAHGDLALIPPRRAYEIVVHAVNPPEGVTVKVNGLVVAAEVNYAESKQELTLRASLASTDRLDLTLSGSPLSYQEDPRPQAFRRLLWAMKANTWLKQHLDEELPRLLSGEKRPRDYPGLNDAQCSALENVLAG